MNISSPTMAAVSGNDVAGFRPGVAGGSTPAGKYTVAARILHWLSALIIVWAMVSGLSAALLPLGPALQGGITSFNVSLTTAFVPVFIFRMVYAIYTQKPQQLADTRGARTAARVAHALLYVLTLVVLLSGVLMMTGDINLFGLVSLSNPLDYPPLNSQFALVHKHSCRLLAMLVLLHVAAVIRHHRAGRKVLTRMT